MNLSPGQGRVATLPTFALTTIAAQPPCDSFGPVCYDTVPPVSTATLSGTIGNVHISKVTITLSGDRCQQRSGTHLLQR